MAMRITTIGLDADDTLWHNETIFRLTQDRMRDLLADVADEPVFHTTLAAVEKRNLALYGYGVKGFTLSMIETAMELTGGDPPGRMIADILPALHAGAYAAHVPYPLTWAHEMADAPHDHPRFAELSSIADLPGWVRGLA